MRRESHLPSSTCHTTCLTTHHRVGDLTRQRTTLRRRQLGIALRELREEAGLTLEVAGPELDSSASTLSRIEKGQQGANVHLVKSMLDLYDIGGDRWTELMCATRRCCCFPDGGERPSISTPS